MKLPVSIAEKLLLLLQEETIPAARLRHTVTDQMLEDGILQKQRTGSNRHQIFIYKPEGLQAYLHNHFGISDLAAYVAGYNSETLTRSHAVEISSDSKLKSIRTFKGFLVNCITPVSAELNGRPFTLIPEPGVFRFIYDFEHFIPSPDVLITGIENPENFRWPELQQQLWASRQTLFISRYPQSQSGDVIRWLNSIPNPYLHFGDFDFEGIQIYLREYKKHLQERASFFVPDTIASLLAAYGNRDLYNRQLAHQPDITTISEPAVIQLLELLHRHKKVLEQEALIGR